MAKRPALLLIFSVLLAALGCGKSDVITDKDPFFQKSLTIKDTASEEVVRVSVEFAKQAGLQLSINRFGGRKISILIYNKELNIQAMNTIEPNRFQVDAITRQAPTEIERDMVDEYVRYLRPLESQ